MNRVFDWKRSSKRRRRGLCSSRCIRIRRSSGFLELRNVFRTKSLNRKKYWPDDDIEARKANLVVQLRKILSGLQTKISGIQLEVPDADKIQTLSSLKVYEDTIDALVCGYVGMCYLQRQAQPYGDETAAIWIPALTPQHTGNTDECVSDCSQLHRP